MNPYKSKPDYCFWSKGVVNISPEDFDPVVSTPFKIYPSDKVATAGSCFAQHIAKKLIKTGFSYLVTEVGSEERNYGVFPARFGNIYTIKQLLQLFQRAYGLFDPVDKFWRRDGRYIDPFRPKIEYPGFDSLELLVNDREIHLAAVRQMFEECDVFVFTLGLTEGWKSIVDDAVFPLAPGVGGEPENDNLYAFSNFEIMDMVDDLRGFIKKLRIVNQKVRIVLTVSPVPLVATYEDRHVVLSNSYSKSALRVVADIISKSVEGVAYFPSYEIITAPQNKSCYFEHDLRTVTPDGVNKVMSLFEKYFLSECYSGWSCDSNNLSKSVVSIAERERLNSVICDELELDR